MINHILKKTHKRSFIKRFHVTSRFSDSVFKENGNYVVLQVMEISDQELIAELIKKEDYERGEVI